MDLDKTILLLKEFFKENLNIQAAFIFGSYNDGTANSKSDLDLALLFKNEIDLWTEMALQVKISKVIQFEKIDLLNLNKAPLRIQFAAISTGKLIFEAELDQTSDFLEEVLNRYHDMEFRYKVFFKEWDEGLKEDYQVGEP